MTATAEMTMRVLITGSRTWLDQGTVHKAIAATVKQHFFGYDAEPSKKEMESVFRRVTIVHGGARGADNIADEFARDHGMRVEVFHPDWEKHGKKAGPIRNQEMVTSKPKPDVCLAFLADNSSRGTEGTIKLARRKGIDVRVIPDLASMRA